MSLKGALEKPVSVRPMVSFYRVQREQRTYLRTHSKPVVESREGTAFPESHCRVCCQSFYKKESTFE